MAKKPAKAPARKKTPAKTKNTTTAKTRKTSPAKKPTSPKTPAQPKRPAASADLKDYSDNLAHAMHMVEGEIERMQSDIAEMKLKGEVEAANQLELRLKTTERLIETYKDKAAEIPYVLDAFNLGKPVPTPVKPNITKVVEPTKLKPSDIKLIRPELTKTQLTHTGARDVLVKKNGNLVQKQMIGKMRFKAADDHGRPAPFAHYELYGKVKGNSKPLLIRTGRTDYQGYTSLNLSEMAVNDVESLSMSFRNPNPAIEGKILYHVPDSWKRPEFSGRDIFRIPLDRDIIDILKDAAGDADENNGGTIEDPDEADITVSPGSFGLNEEHVDGNCCLRPRAEFPAKEYYFRQTVRLTDVEDVNLVFNGDEEFERQEIGTPIDYLGEGPSTYAVLGGNVILGLSNLYKHAWYPAGRGLGQNLYSVSLLPCEEINLAFIDWSRQERDTRVESRTQSEALEHDLQHNRIIDEVVDATINEHQSGGTTAGGGGASLDLGFFAIGGGGGSTSSNSSGRRNVHVSTTQGISDSVTQNASSLRHQRATVVTTSYQSESERIKTRTIHNHNMNHVMNVQYYQHVEHYIVKTELVEEKPVLLIPYAVDEDIFGTIGTFEKFKVSPSVPVTKFLDRHSRILRRMVPRRLRRAFPALSRLLHCGDIYEIEDPYATFSRWEITLSAAWRPGITFFIETHSGQSVKLKPLSTSGTARTFASNPVRHDDIKSILISFDANEAAENGGSGILGSGLLGGTLFEDIISNMLEHKVDDITIFATTDRSRYVSTPQSFLIDSASVNTTLNTVNPSVTISLTAPTVDFSSYRGREHHDYCRVKELIAHIQKNPMRYMRAIWLTENPNRRAIRFDQYELSGTSLLDHIVNKPIGILGNYVAFELLDGHRLVPLESPDFVVSSRIVTVPTRGVFGEVYLSCCNATEKRDVERMIDQDRRCQNHAPEITGVTPGSRAMSSDTTPTPFASPMVSIQNAPGVPDPSGMANSLSVLGTPDIFRDMSNATALLSLIDNATKEAFTSTRQHRAAMDALAGDVVRGLVSAYTGVPIAGSKPPGASSSGTSGITPDSSNSATTGGAETSVPKSAEISTPGLQAVTSEQVRQTPPTQLSDHMQTIQKGVDSGLLTPQQGQDAANGLVGNVGTQTITTTADDNSADFELLGTDSRTVDVKLRAFIPAPAIILGYPGESAATGGDDRSFTYDPAATSRCELHYKVDFGYSHSSPVSAQQERKWGETTEYAITDSTADASKPSWYRNLNSGAAVTDRATLGANDSNLKMTPSYDYPTNLIGTRLGGPRALQLAFMVNGSNPLVTGSPAINADLVLLIKEYNGQLWYALSGSHDGFPAYELYVDEKLVYSHDPISQNQSPWSLFPPSEYDVGVQWRPLP